MFLPKTLPDELLFSRIVRLLLISGSKAAQVQAEIFGSSRACVHPILTQHLSLLCNYGGVSPDLLFGQTLGALYQMCLPPAYQSVSERMIDGEINPIGRLWQLPNSQGRQSHVLRSCSQCAINDIETLGVSYWHKTHQMPNVVACPIHGNILYSQRLLPRYHLSVKLPTINTLSMCAASNDVEYAHFCARLIKRNEYENKEKLLKFIKMRLSFLGYVTDNERLRRGAVCKSLYICGKGLNQTQAYSFPQSDTDYKFLHNMLSPHHFCHPGRMCLFLYWLAQCKRHRDPAVRSITSPAMQKKALEEQCLSLLRKGTSLNETANLIKKSRTYVKSVALKYGLTSRLTPKCINSVMRDHIVSMAFHGWHRKVIATRFDISTGSVEMVISSIPELVKRRRQIKFESMRRRYRATILRFMASHSDLIRQTVFAENNAAAHWLYKNDHQWLIERLPEAQISYIKRRKQ